MNEQVLGIGLHICKSIEKNEEGNLVGIDCNQKVYSSMNVLYACVVGRPPTVQRVIKLYLNDSIAKISETTNSPNVILAQPIDERFVGNFRVEYVESGCTYWVREFVMGTCPPAAQKPDIPLHRLVELLYKYRTE